MSTPVRVGVIGASGNIGSAIVRNLSSRGTFEIKAVARDATKIDVNLPSVTAISGDATDSEQLINQLKGIDVLVSAIFFNVSADELTNIARGAGAKRLIAVGGAGSLRLTEGGPYFVDTPEFPEEYKTLAREGVKFYEQFKTIDNFDWVLVSPAAEIGPGPATSTYRAGKDILLTDAEGRSVISYDDFAQAIVDEIVDQKNAKTRITFAQ